MTTNREEVMAALTSEWQDTGEIAGKIPPRGRDMKQVARGVLLKLRRDGIVEAKGSRRKWWYRLPQEGERWGPRPT